MKKALVMFLVLWLALAASLGAACREPTPTPTSTPLAFRTATPTPPSTPTTTTTPLPSPTRAAPSPTPIVAPSPTATPAPPPGKAVYRNTTYGLSLYFPKDWVEAETGEKAPLVDIVAPGGLPLVRVSLFYLPQEKSLADFSKETLAQVQQGLTQVEKVSEKEVSLGDVTGRDVVFTAYSGSNQIKVKTLFVLRGSQAFVVMAVSTRVNYDRMEGTINEVVASFRLEESRPLGLSRQTSLVLYDTGPVTLDPHLARETGSSSYIVEVFSGLVTLDQKLSIQPELAERWGMSPDGKTYTFYLRQGAKFHSGREVTAADFKFSLERAADPTTKSPTTASYLGDIVGVKEKLEGKASEVRGVKVVDNYTLQVTIDAPKAYFLAKLSHTPAMVVDRENVAQGGEWWRKPNGTGPFKLKEWKKDDLLVLERNPLYYGPVPKLENVIFRLYGGIPMLMYESGEIDMAPMSLEDLERVQDPANPLSKELVSSPRFTLSYIGFNNTKPPFDDAKVRQAFSLAIDKDKLINLVLKGAVAKAEGILPPGMPGYSADLKGLPFDANKAKELLAQSTYAGELPSITITLPGRGGEIGSLTSALLQMWKDNLGVEVKVRQLEPERYSYDIKKEKDELFSLGWVADYPDPENFLDMLFHTGAEDNTGEYSSPQVDALLEAARTEPDVSRRLALYRQAEEKIVQEAAVIPLFFDRDYVLVKPYVEGYVLTPMIVPYLKYISLKPH